MSCNNKEFDNFKDSEKYTVNINSKNRLQLLNDNQKIYKKKYMDYTYNDFIIGYENNMSGLLQDLVNKPISINIFKQDDRLFFLGITILSIMLLLILLKQ